LKESAHLWSLYREIQKCRFIDLTHTFSEHTPHCESFPQAQRVTLFDYTPGIGTVGSGFLAHEYRHVGQWGTHVDPGAHFVQGKRFLDEIPVDEMILPFAVIDIRAAVARDPDYCLVLDDVLRWEARHGALPPGAFVAQHSGWSKRWPSQDRMMNRDAAGVAHFPGWTMPALRYIFETRGASACGHETTDTDSGLSISRGETPLERYVLGLDRWQIELLASMDDVAEAGSLIVASWPKPLRGSGFPARVFAICPETE
jgi:kynurenine formamidase